MFWIGHVVWQQHVIKSSCDFIGAPQGKSPACHVWWSYKHYGNRNVMVSVCHVAS